MAITRTAPSQLRLGILFTAIGVALAACGGGGGGGAPAEPPVAGVPGPGPGPAPAPSPAPTPAPAPSPNVPPTASIAPVADGQIVGQPVALTSTSTDPNAGQTLTNRWVLLQRPVGSAAALSGTTGGTVTLVPDTVGSYQVQLFTSDGRAESSATVTFTAAQSNLPPTAAIANAQPASPIAGQTVTLTGTGSDPDNRPITYAWTITRAPAGSTASLSNGGAGATVTFFPNRSGAYQLSLVTSDGVNTSTAATTTVNVGANLPPTASIAGCPSTAITGQTISLQGTGTDPEAGLTGIPALTYQWSLTSAPAGNTGTILPLASAQSINFRPTVPTTGSGTYRLDLVTNDGLNPSPVASCVFTVTGDAVPNASFDVRLGGAGGAIVGSSGSPTVPQIPSVPQIPTLTLTATSTDPDNGPSPLTHTWRIVSGSGTLSATSGATVSFTPSGAGSYTLGLVSFDGFVSSTEATRTLVVNAPPTASFTVNGQAPGTATIRAGEPVTLASTSTDPEGAALDTSWSVTPPGGGAAITGTGASFTFTTSDTASTPYLATLTVDDRVNPSRSLGPVTIPVQAQPGATACNNPAGYAQGVATRFAPVAADGTGARPVSTGSTGAVAGNSACFQRSVYQAIAGSDTIPQGSYRYFEVVRSLGSSNDDGDLAVGVATAAAPQTRLQNGDWPASRQAVVVQGSNTLFGTSTSYDGLGAGTQPVVGFAVDYRERYPVVFVIGTPNPSRAAILPANCVRPIPPSQTSPTAADVKPVCVLNRFAINTTADLRVYAFGRNGSKATINGGEAAPYTYTAAQRREALSAAFVDAERGLDPQLVPNAAGTLATALPTPTIARASGSPWRTVLLTDSVARAGLRTSLSVTAMGGNVRWVRADGTQIATGTTINLIAARASILNGATPPAGGGTTFRIDAIATQTGATNDDLSPSGTAAMSVSVPFFVTFSPPEDANFDHDGDGQTYTQELNAGTDPADPDSNNDGIADGQTVPVGWSRSGRTLLARELPGSDPARTVQGTAQGVRVLDDGQSVVLTDLLNPACVENPPFGVAEICNKRGVRANVGVPFGEFRYFEVTNLLWTDNVNAANYAGRRQPNMGAGVIASASEAVSSPSGQFPALNGTGFATSLLDPFCCFLGADPATTAANTAPSSTFNFAAGSFRRLVAFGNLGASGASATVGVAVDHRQAGSVTVRFVYSNSPGVANVSSPITIPITGDAMPLVFGHPQGFLTGDNVTPAIQVNFGLRPFVYDDPTRFTQTLRTTIDSALVPGVGANQRNLN